MVKSFARAILVLFFNEESSCERFDLILSWRKTRSVWGRLLLLNFLLWLIAVASILLLILPLFFFFLPLLVGVVGVVCGLLLNEADEPAADATDDRQTPENPAFPEPLNG